jgi:LuxR family maltose regulon positive regulatory protein
MVGHAILALIAVDQGNPDDAEQHARTAREIMAAARPDLRAAPLATVEILLRLAPVLSDAGDRPGAIALTEEARQLLTSSPHRDDAQLARLDRLERRLAARPPKVPLTEREVAVLHLLSGTLPLREVGLVLGLSQNTIKSHVKAIYRKLDVATRHDAIARGREIGIL